MSLGLAFQIEQHNNRIRKGLRDQLLAMQPEEFEVLVSQLLAEMGFERVEATRRSGDGGIDVRGTLVGGGCPHQNGRPSQKVETQEQLPVSGGSAGARQPGAHEQGLIITTSAFSKGAVREPLRPTRPPLRSWMASSLWRP